MMKSTKLTKLTIRNYETIWPSLKVGDKLYYSCSFRWVDVRWHSSRFGCQVSFKEQDDQGNYVIVTQSCLK